MQKYKLLLLVVLIVTVLDQLTKALIYVNYSLHESVEVISGLFNITYIRNPGAAFGIFSDGNETLRTLFLSGISIVALVIIFIIYRNTKEVAARFAFSLIAGGALGNLIDRVRFGEVVDFLDFYLGTYHWPAFNVADSAITIGVILSVFYLNWGKTR